MLKLPEDERLAYNRYVDNLHYHASMVESSYGIGKLKGEKIGEKRGRESATINLLDVLDDAAIARKTGLPLEEVEKLRRNNKNKWLSANPTKYQRAKSFYTKFMALNPFRPKWP